MPILFLIPAVAAAILAGFLAAAVPPYAILVATGCVLVAAFAFLAPKLSLLLLLASMLFSPEIALGAVPGGRSLVLRYDDILVVVIFLSWFARTAIFKDRPFITRTPVQTPILVYTGLAIASTSLGILRGDIEFATSFFYILKYVEYFLIYFMTVNVLDSQEDVKKYLRYSCLLALAVTFYAYYYYYSAAGPGARASMPFEAPIGKPQESEPASLGGYYLMVFGIVLALMTEYSGSVPLLAAALMAFMFPAFLLSFSRASYIGFVVMLAGLILKTGKRRLLLVSILVAGAAALFGAREFSGKVRERVEMTYSGKYAVNTVGLMGIDIKLEESAYVRYVSLRKALTERLPKHPFLGRGVTGVGLADTQFALLLGEMGLIGFFAFFWMLHRIYTAAGAVYRAYEEPWIKATALGLMVALGGLLAQGVGVNTFVIVRIMEPFWFLTAVVMKLYLMKKGGTGPAAGPAIKL